MADDFLSRLYLSLSWVKVTSGGVSEILDLVVKRSSDLGLHTEVLQSREDPTTWILCDYHRDVPHEGWLGYAWIGMIWNDGL